MRFYTAFRCLAVAALFGSVLLTGCASDESTPKTTSSTDSLAAQARRFRNTRARPRRHGTFITSTGR